MTDIQITLVAQVSNHQIVLVMTKGTQANDSLEAVPSGCRLEGKAGTRISFTIDPGLLEVPVSLRGLAVGRYRAVL